MRENVTILKVMYTNADQLLNKMNCLKVHVANREMDIIIVFEVIPKAQKIPFQGSVWPSRDIQSFSTSTVISVAHLNKAEA